VGEFDRSIPYFVAFVTQYPASHRPRHPDGIAVAINDRPGGRRVGRVGRLLDFQRDQLLLSFAGPCPAWGRGKVTNLGSLGGAFGNQAHGISRPRAGPDGGKSQRPSGKEHSQGGPRSEKRQLAQYEEQ
jgi:hypothetical protein